MPRTYPFAHVTLERTRLWSLRAQLATGAVCVATLAGAASTSALGGPLWTLLLIEVLVQLIELLSYTVLLAGSSVATMAATRYYDWALTTPLMLVTVAAYCLNARERARARVREDGFIPAAGAAGAAAESGLSLLRGMFEVHTGALARMLAANFAMLAAGFAAETGRVSTAAAGVAGFAALAVVFGTLWHEFAQHTAEGAALVATMLVAWAAYGVAFLRLGAVDKNRVYNLTDVVAKNFFGLFLSWKLALTLAPASAA